MDDFTKKTEAANKVLDAVGKQSLVATAAIVGLGIAVGKMAADYNASFAKVETLIPGQTERINELKKAVQSLSPEVRKNTADLAEGLYQTLSAYGDAPDTIEKVTLAAKAATAGLASPTESIDLLSAVTKAYGDTSAEAQSKVSDLAFVAVKNGKTTFPELANSIQRVTSLSATLGVSQEELMAVFAAGTGVIGGAAEVSTKMAATQAELLKGTEPLQKAFTALGATSGEDLIAKFGGLQGAMLALKGYADETGVGMTNLFGSIEAGQFALYYTGEGANKMARDLEDMKTAAGATDEAFTAITTGVNKFGDGLTQAQLNATVFGQRLGDEVLKSAEGLLSPLVAITQALANMDEGTLEALVSAGKIAGGLLGTTAAVVGFAKGALMARQAVLALTGALAANPFGLFVIAATTAIMVISEFDKLTSASYKNQIDSSKRYVDRLANERDENRKLSQEYETKSEKLTSLLDRYKKLEDTSKTNTKAQAELKTVVKQIGEIVPDAATQWDKYGNAIEINAGKAEAANKAFQEIARQRLELSIIEAKRMGEALRIELDTHTKWLDANGAKATAGDSASTKAQTLKAIISRFQTEQKLITDQYRGDATSQAEQINLARKELFSAATGLGVKIEPGNEAGAMSVLLAYAGKLSSEAAASEKLFQEYKLRTERINEIREQLAKKEVAEEQLATLNNPAGKKSGDAPDTSKKDSSDRLAQLDAQYAAERELAKRNRESTYQIEQEYLTKRSDLLVGFLADSMAKGTSFGAALNTQLGLVGKTIELELAKTREGINSLTLDPVVLSVDTQVSLLDSNGMSVEEALKRIKSEAGSSIDAEAKNIGGLTTRQAALNQILLSRNLTDQNRAAITSELAEVTQTLTDAEARRAAALALQAEVSDRLLASDLARISQTAETTEAAIDREIALKKELGLLGSNDKEIQANATAEKKSKLLEAQKEIIDEVNRLQASGSDEDKARAEALKKEILEIKEATDKLGEGSGFQKFFANLTAGIDEIGSYVKSVFSGIADTVTSLIGINAEKEAREYADRLTALEQEKNERLTELDNELSDLKKAKDEENAAREEAEREEEYQAERAQYSRSITALQSSIDQETNILNLRELEKQLEAARKTKREAAEARKKEKEDAAREAAQTAAQNELLNERALMEYEYTKAQVELENQSGTAAANAAIEKARWDKASTVLTLTLTSIADAARAASSYPIIPNMIAYSISASVAAAGAITAAMQPEPPPYTPQPLPSAPRLLAAGAVFLPTAGGTGVKLPDGSSGITAEAGVPEMWLPITPANIESLFRAAGVGGVSGGTRSGFTYAPSYVLQFSQADGTTKEEVFAYLKNDVSRELLEVVEDAKRQFYVGPS